MNLSAYLACLLCVALDMKFNNLFYIETKENPNYWVPVKVNIKFTKNDYLIFTNYGKS